MLIKTLTFLILAMPLVSSAAESKKVKLHNRETKMKAEVLKRIPIGSFIERAQIVMQKSGFECEMVWNKTFGDYDEQGNPTPPPRALPQIGGIFGDPTPLSELSLLIHSLVSHFAKQVDFLYCDKEKAAFPYILGVTRRWQIAIVHKNGVVTEVRVAISLTGP